MTRWILNVVTASISEFKKNPLATVATGKGSPVAILNRHTPVFYCIPADAYEAMMDKLEDLDLNVIAEARSGQSIIHLTIDEL